MRTRTGLGEFRRKAGPRSAVFPKDAGGFKEGTCVVSSVSARCLPGARGRAHVGREAGSKARDRGVTQQVGKCFENIPDGTCSWPSQGEG